MRPNYRAATSMAHVAEHCPLFERPLVGRLFNRGRGGLTLTDVASWQHFIHGELQAGECSSRAPSVVEKLSQSLHIRAPNYLNGQPVRRSQRRHASFTGNGIHPPSQVGEIVYGFQIFGSR